MNSAFIKLNYALILLMNIHTHEIFIGIEKDIGGFLSVLIYEVYN